ncbi:MAG: lectin-like protein, partial [Flavobacteriales bacterium]
VFESGRHRISKIDVSGNVTRVIGDYNSSGWGDTDGDNTQAQFRNINGMAYDSSGNLFVTDEGKIKKITFDPGSGEATSTTFAGTGNWGDIDGAGSDAEFREPSGIVIDGSDMIYVADRHNHKIRKITPSGEVSTFAGDGYGYQDGSLLSSRFRSPTGMSKDSNGDIYITETDGNRIRKIDISENSVSTVAGSGTYGHLDSDLMSSKFKSPRGILATASAIYIADSDNHRIRTIELVPTIKIPAGSTTGNLTLKGIDDFKFEVDETVTVSISSYTNLVDSSIADINALVTSLDAAPVARISLSDDVLDERVVGTVDPGTLDVTVSLSDAYSSVKTDMSASNKADYYYLGTYNGSKYYSSKNQNHYNYSEAKSAAATLGGQLAIITSSSEQETIVSGIYAQDPDYSADDNVWLNHWIGYDFDDTNWVWENGVTSGYENWTDTWQRDEHPSREAAYLHTNGLWHSTRERDHRRFVVEFSSAISDSETVVDISFADANLSGTSIEGAAGADFTSNLTGGKLTIAAGSPSGSLVLTAVDDD